MVRASTQSFALLLDSGEEVRGVMVQDDVAKMGSMIKRKILVHGSAVYRPSGKLLRIDADKIESGENAPDLWARIPDPIASSLPTLHTGRSATKSGGISAFIGRWPGDESDSELLELLRELG